jgi:hypothetical protein
MLAVRPRHQHYSLYHVRLFLRAVLELPASLRGAAALFPLLAAEGLVSAEDSAGPTAPCGRWWLLRVGLYELQRPKERADDWIWFVDHTIQLGAYRVLLIVGVRLSAWEAKGRGALKHGDLQVILLEPVQTSNSQIVLSQLKRAAQITGAPRAIVYDQCRELNNAGRLFQAAHPQTVCLNDLKHRLALLLERRLKPDPRWAEFTQACQQMRKKTQQTALAFLAPPATKEKARFMNLGELVRWAGATRHFLDRPAMPPGVPLERERLESVFGGLRQFDAELRQWQSLMDLTDTAMRSVRQNGYYRGCDEAWRQQLAPRADNPAAQSFLEDLVSFVAQQTAPLYSGQYLPGTSEILESLIGKGKRLEGQQSKGGFTRMVLGLAAAVVHPTNDFLQQALDTVRTKHVVQWARQHLGHSLQGLRQQTLGQLTREQKQNQLPALPSPNF